MEENENIENVEEMSPPPVIEKVSIKEILEEKNIENQERIDKLYNDFIEIIKSIPEEELDDFNQYCDNKLNKLNNK